jgi:hypothetical protein
MSSKGSARAFYFLSTSHSKENSSVRESRLPGLWWKKRPTPTCTSDRLPSRHAPPIARMRRAATNILSMTGTDAARPRYHSRLLAALDAQARGEPPPPPPTMPAPPAARPHPTLGALHARARRPRVRPPIPARAFSFCTQTRDRRLTHAQGGARED